MSEHRLVMTTTADAAAADHLARTLVAERLAGCVQIVPIVSHYVWDGRAERNEEHLLLVKTAADRAAAACHRIEALHEYDVPEVVTVDLDGGSAPYLAWLTAQTRA